MRRLILSLILTFVAMQTAALAQSYPGFIQGQVPTAPQWNSYFSGKTDALGGTLTNGIILNGTIDGAAIGATTPALGAFTKLTLTPPAVTGLAASANGYTIEQDMTYNLSSSASGIYFGNEFNTVVNGDPRSGAQVWNNLDRMFAKTAATSTANLVNRDIQSVRPLTFGTPKQTLWGLIVDVVDETGLDSLHGGGLLGLELDLQANDLDNSPDVTRQGIVVSLFHGNGTGSGGVSPQATSALGVFSAGDGAANFKSTIQLAAPFRDAAIDVRFSGVVAGGTSHALWLGSGLDIALDTPGSNTINYNSGFNSIALNQSGTVLFYANTAGAHFNVPLTAEASTGLDLSLSGTGAMLLSSGTTAQRPDTGNAGEMRYNTTTSRYEFGVGGSWVNHVRLSGDTMTGALHMGANTLDGSAVAFTGGTLSGLTSLGVTGATTGPSFESANGVDLIISPGGNGHKITFGDPTYGIGSIAVMNFATGANTFVMGQGGSQLQANSIYAGRASTTTFSGSQATPGTQYGFLQLSNLAGSVTSGTIAVNKMDVSNDVVALPAAANGANYLLVTGNYGLLNSWAQSASHTSGQQVANGGNIYQETVASCTSSNVGSGPSGTGTGITDNSCSWDYVSLNGAGNRAALANTLLVRSQIGLSSGATKEDQQWQAEENTTMISASQGGTAPTSGSSAGIVYAGGDQMWCQSGALNLDGCIGRETDVGIYTGASAAHRIGINVVAFGNLRGNDSDIAYAIGAQLSAPGFTKSFSVGMGSIDPAGTILGYSSVVQGALINPGFTYRNPVASLGVDFAPFRFTGAAVRTAGNGGIDGSGYFFSGAAKLSTSSTTVSLDAPGSIVTAVSTLSAGTFYKAGDEAYDAGGSGTIVTINTVDGSGVPLTWTLTKAGGVLGAAPSNPVSFLGGTGINLAFNLAWTRVGTLQLNASGGNTIVGTGSALATGAASGFPLLPTTTAAPTGTVGAAGQAAFIIRTDSHKLCHSEGGGTWYYADGTTCS